MYSLMKRVPSEMSRTGIQETDEFPARQANDRYAWSVDRTSVLAPI